MIPQSFEEWQHCITVKCGIALTESYCRKRIEALENTKAYETEKFTALYGDDYRQQVLGWFQHVYKALAPAEPVTEPVK